MPYIRAARWKILEEEKAVLQELNESLRAALRDVEPSGGPLRDSGPLRDKGETCFVCKVNDKVISLLHQWGRCD